MKNNETKYCCDCAYYQSEDIETPWCCKHHCDVYDVKPFEDGNACKDWAIGITSKLDWEDVSKLLIIAENYYKEKYGEEGVYITKEMNKEDCEEIIRLFNNH